MRKLKILLFSALLGGLALPAHAEDDTAQICMFRCAPQLGSAGYDQCLDDCFEEEGGGETAAASADAGPLFGFWQGEHTACGTVTDDSWYIDASGASPFESTCSFLSVARNDNVFTLTQTCEYYEDEVEQMTVVITLVEADRMVIDGDPYLRCRR